MKALNSSSNGKINVLVAVLLVVLVLLAGGVAGFTYLGNSSKGTVLTHNLAEPLGDVTSAKIAIDNGDGNMVIDSLTGGEPLLAGGTLQYLEKQGLPSRTMTSMNGQASLTLKAGSGSQPWFRFPWDACNGATEWQIHLNPGVQSDLTAHSGGGNVKLDLSGMALTSIVADTGGGNMDVSLPDKAANLTVTARTGAGNVTVLVPGGMAARIHATSGAGNVIVDPRFTMIDKNTFQSPDYDSAANKVEITASSGAGNVSVSSK